MSRLARRVGAAACVVLGIQFAAALVIQAALSESVRGEVIRQLTRGMEDAGALTECTARPGPWAHDEGWWTAWPVTPGGQPVGTGAPLNTVDLPTPRATRAWSSHGQSGLIYASAARGCGGLLVVQHSRFPLLESESARVAQLAGLRVLILPLAALALVALTAVPLVRRIRGLSRAMERVVSSDFEGAVDDGANDELGEVARAFDAAAATARERLERLEHRDAVLRRAMADLAHDLRTPLATLTLSASSLPPSESAATIRAELGFLQGMAQNFEALLDDTPEDVRPVRLDELVDRMGPRFGPLARDRGLSFETALPDEALMAEAGAVALERALGNLVQNATRFARAHVVVLLFRDGDEIRLEVRDDGPGFGDLSRRAAERGTRGDDGEEAGFGLGLAIAEATARRYGGRLELGAGEDGETRVTIVLPLASAAQSLEPDGGE